MLRMPIRIRRRPPLPPENVLHYEVPTLAPEKKPSFCQLTYQLPARSTGDGKNRPPMILVGCDEPFGSRCSR